MNGISASAIYTQAGVGSAQECNPIKEEGKLLDGDRGEAGESEEPSEISIRKR
jgi:hypothetical protein